MIKYTLTCDENGKSSPDKLKLLAAVAVLEMKRLELIAAAAVITAKTPKTI